MAEAMGGVVADWRAEITFAEKGPAVPRLVGVMNMDEP